MDKDDLIQINENDLLPQVEITQEDLAAVDAEMISLDVTDLKISIKINQPQGEPSISSRQIDISGEVTAPGIELGIFVNNDQIQQRVTSQSNNRFVFKNVQLDVGENKICVKALDGPSESQTIRVQASLPIFIGSSDWYTLEPLQIHDNVVRCKKCKGFLLKATWDLHGCRCNKAGKAQGVFRPNDPGFNKPEEVVDLT